MAKIYAIESPVLEMGRNLKNKLSAVRVKAIVTTTDFYDFSLHLKYIVIS